MLRSKVSSDIAILEDLRQSYEWIPGKDNIRPTTETIKKKVVYLENIKYYYVTETDYILDIIFDLPSILVDSKIQVPIDNLTLECKFTENMFPYDLPESTKHYILWYSYKCHEITDAKINDDISTNIRILVGNELKSNFDFIWYENPKKTIETIYHVQVFWTMK